MALFSVRHRRALEAGNLEIELHERLRGRLWRALIRLDVTWGEVDDSNWHYDTSVLQEIPSSVLDSQGSGDLRVDNQQVTLEEFVRSAPGALVCDVLESFALHPMAPEDSAAQFNEVFEQEETPWRLLQGHVVKLDSGLLASMLDEAYRVSTQAGFTGPSRELLHAQDDLLDGDVRGAIHLAGNSFESTAMALLGIHGKVGTELVALLRDAGYFDALAAPARSAFFKQVMQAVPGMRNNLGGHGQGKEHVSLPAAYGKLAIHLAGAMNLFLLELAIERGYIDNPARQPIAAEPDAPAADFSSPTDDIPF